MKTADLPVSVAEIAASTVFKKAKLEAENQRWDLWARLGEELYKRLGAEATVERVYFYYLPIFFWMEKVMDMPREGPCIVGVSCPQGGGKTTLTSFLKICFELLDQTCVIASTDDFYLTRKGQQQLAEKHSGNRLLELRGNPGTIDVDLAARTIDAVQSLRAGEETLITRYDKSAFSGLGDRAPESAFCKVEGPVDIILFEGWCVGFRPVAEDAIVDRDLEQVNGYLKTFQTVYDKFDSLLVIEVDDPSVVYRWRQEAEDKMKASGKPGMSEEQLKDFVDRYMPSYEQYLPGLYGGKVVEGPELRVKISPQRKPV